MCSIYSEFPSHEIQRGNEKPTQAAIGSKYQIPEVNPNYDSHLNGHGTNIEIIEEDDFEQSGQQYHFRNYY